MHVDVSLYTEQWGEGKYLSSKHFRYGLLLLHGSTLNVDPGVALECRNRKAHRACKGS